MTSEVMLPEGVKVLCLEDGEIYTIHDATRTNNQFGYGVYLYRVKERLNTGFGLYRKWFTVLKECDDCGQFHNATYILCKECLAERKTANNADKG